MHFVDFIVFVKPHPLRSASFTPVNKKCSSSLEENIFLSFLSFLDMIFFTFASWQKKRQTRRHFEFEIQR